VDPAPPSRRQIVIRRVVTSVVATALLAVIGGLLVTRGDRADQRSDTRTGMTTAATAATSASVPTTTTAPSAPTVVADRMALTVLVIKHWRLRHLRFVGIDVAAQLVARGLVLEELPC